LGEISKARPLELTVTVSAKEKRLCTWNLEKCGDPEKEWGGKKKKKKKNEIEGHKVGHWK